MNAADPAVPVVPDRAVLNLGSSSKELSIAEFLKYPIEEQVDLLIQGKVSFFAGANLLRTTEAMKLLRKRRVSQQTAH